MAVFLSGPESMPYGIRSTALRDILPIVPSQRPPANPRQGPEESFRVTLTPTGRAHEIMALSSSPSENEQIWADQPAWSWRLPIENVKPGAEVLAYASPTEPADEPASVSVLPASDDAEDAIARFNATRLNQNRNALLVVRGQGRGRVAMLMTDRTWRLRYRVGDTYHHRFWGQMIRWGVGEKLSAGNDHVRIGTDQLHYTPHEPIRVLARLADASSTPIADASPVAELSRDGRAISRVALQYRPDSNGMYEAVLPPLPETGTYAVTLECPDVQRRLGSEFPKHRTARFSVITARHPAEFVHATIDRKIPETMARLSGGRVVPPSRALSLWDTFGAGSGSVSDRIETNLWDSPWLFLAVLACLTAEWLLRKRGSLA